MTGANDEAASAIEIRNVTKRFGDIVAVDNVSLAVPRGAFLVLVGPSGCGKSTLLRMLAGLESPTEGSFVFMNRTISDAARGVVSAPGTRDAGLVFQSYALWPHMTVAANIEWPLKVARWTKADRAARVEAVLGLLAISELGDRYPAEISGGQQQRVAIARTIGPKPSILLFDEPLSNLDAKLRIEMRSELMRIHRATGATSVYVTHDQVEALTMASHVAVLNGGRVEQFGAPMDLLDDPQTTFVATFLGTPPANLVEATRSGDGLVYEGARLADAERARGHEQVQLLYRAHELTVGEAPEVPSIAARFDEAAPIAGRTMVTALAGGRRITAMADGHFVASSGDEIRLSFLNGPGAIFAMNGERIA